MTFEDGLAPRRRVTLLPVRGLLVWLGIYLREGRLKELIPVRKTLAG